MCVCSHMCVNVSACICVAYVYVVYICVYECMYVCVFMCVLERVICVNV